MKTRNAFSREDVIRAAAGMRKASQTMLLSNTSAPAAKSSRSVSAGLSAAEINQAYSAARKRLMAA